MNNYKIVAVTINPFGEYHRFHLRLRYHRRPAAPDFPIDDCRDIAESPKLVGIDRMGEDSPAEPMDEAEELLPLRLRQCRHGAALSIQTAHSPQPSLETYAKQGRRLSGRQGGLY
jgi:hypothetical protein